MQAPSNCLHTPYNRFPTPSNCFPTPPTCFPTPSNSFPMPYTCHPVPINCSPMPLNRCHTPYNRSPTPSTCPHRESIGLSRPSEWPFLAKNRRFSGVFAYISLISAKDGRRGGRLKRKYLLSPAETAEGQPNGRRFVVPDGTRPVQRALPPMNRWAILFRPAGLGEKERGCVEDQPQRARCGTGRRNFTKALRLVLCTQPRSAVCDCAAGADGRREELPKRMTRAS